MAPVRKTADPEVGLAVARIRELERVQDILAELKRREELLRLDPSVLAELESYLPVQRLLPELLSADVPETVKQAQLALHAMQGKLDRVAAIHLGTRKILRSLARLETMAKAAMANHGFITEKTSKPSADQLLSLSLPELMIYETDWTCLGKLCQDVQEHLGHATDVLKLQMKLDENLHWAQRAGA